jgi:hypothetical protein
LTLIPSNLLPFLSKVDDVVHCYWLIRQLIPVKSIRDSLPSELTMLKWLEPALDDSVDESSNSSGDGGIGGSENGDGDAKDSDDELEASCRADVVDAWNGERLQVLDDAIAHRLIPALKSGLEKKLRDSSRQAVVYGASAKLRSQYLTLGPFVPMSVRQNNPAEALTSRAGAGGARVVGVCVSDDKRFGDALVALTEQGAVNILFFLMLAGRIEREVFLRRNSPCTFLFKYSKLCTHTF